jgi:hypothetical protein
MRTVFWSVKGGSGVTVTAAALALNSPDCLLVDLCGDTALALGVDEPTVGLAAWLHSPNDVDASALDRLIVNVRPGLALLPSGTTRPELHAPNELITKRFAMLGDYLAERSSGEHSSAKGQRKQRVLSSLHESSPKALAGVMQWSNVVVDAGSLGRSNPSALSELLNGVDHSLLMVKSCFLAVHAAVGTTLRVDGVVVFGDEERRITDHDISAALGHRVRTTMLLQPSVARAVDAGLLAARLPRSFTRSLEALHPTIKSPSVVRRGVMNRLPVAS